MRINLNLEKSVNAARSLRKSFEKLIKKKSDKDIIFKSDRELSREIREILNNFK